MLSQDKVKELVNKKVPDILKERLFEKLLDIALNDERLVVVTDKWGKPQFDMTTREVMKVEMAPYAVSNQLSALKMVMDYAIGKPIQPKEDEDVDKSKNPSFVVVLPSNNR